jgi:demethylmenaquinone methyltransferase / 2-methoxy-6-polyprenyl-1,4-benzoquinol methylase
MVEKQARKIRSMFDSIAGRYDFLNHFLSASIDRRWRRFTRRRLAASLPEAPLVLDLCTGTGDLALEMAKIGRVVGCDFSHPMLRLGHAKIRKANMGERAELVEGDALCLPFPGDTFDGVTIAFGFRNLEDYAGGLREMTRVLRPHGWLAILEFSDPRLPVFRQIYLFYFRHLLPRIGELVSGRKGAYSYLMQSVTEFPKPQALEEMMREANLMQVQHHLLTGGIVALHLGQKPARRR